MTTQESNNDRIALLQGTLDLLILKTLVLGSCHGQCLARLIQRHSEEVFFVDHGSLYLALLRLTYLTHSVTGSIERRGTLLPQVRTASQNSSGAIGPAMKYP